MVWKEYHRTLLVVCLRRATAEHEHTLPVHHMLHRLSALQQALGHGTVSPVPKDNNCRNDRRLWDRIFFKKKNNLLFNIIHQLKCIVVWRQGIKFLKLPTPFFPRSTRSGWRWHFTHRGTEKNVTPLWNVVVMNQCWVKKKNNFASLYVIGHGKKRICIPFK